MYWRKTCAVHGYKHLPLAFALIIVSSLQNCILCNFAELSEQDLDGLADDDSDKYYEGLAKKLSTVVELQGNSLPKSTTNHSNKGNKGSRTTTGSFTQSVDALLDSESKVILDKLKRKGVIRGASSAYKMIHMGKSSTTLHAAGGVYVP